MDAPVAQANRLASQLLSGGAQVRLAKSRKPLTCGHVSKVTILAVSFERIDPLQHASELQCPSEPMVAVWPICLADLLMVVDLLPDPASFLAYAWLRAELTSDKSVLTFMEADILGGFLQNRLRDFLDLRQEGFDRVLLDYRSGAINKYFTKEALGLHVKRPDHAVPEMVTRHLTSLMSNGSEHWPALVRTVFAQKPESWKRLSRMTKKVKRAGLPRRLDFDDPRLTVKVVPSANDAKESPACLVINVE